MPEERLLEALRPVHDKVVAKGPAFWPAGARAWSAPQRALAESAASSVAFPSDDEATGLVRVEWHTVPYDDLYSRAALETLLTYLVRPGGDWGGRPAVACAAAPYPARSA